MNVYDLKYHARTPEDIERRHAHIVGGGIAGLSAAVYLVDDAHMPGQNVTIYEARDVVGGSMDGAGSAQTGYLCRGEREMEPNMECLWNICSKVPSLRDPSRTVLDEVWEYNYEHPLHNEYRLVVQGEALDCHTFSMDDESAAAVMRLLFCDEHELEGLRICDVLPVSFFHGNLWLTFHNMLSFNPTHSAIEAKRYFRRFTHFTPESDYIHGILHTDLNEYDAIIRPIEVWLEGQGVRFATGTAVTEILMSDDHNTAVGLDYRTSEGTGHVDVAPSDMVIFTSGSMSQNSAFGDNTHVAPTNRDTTDRGLFTVWEKLAALDPKFGRPEVFISDIDRTKWVSFFPTITDFPEFYDRLERVSHRPIGMNGVISFPESNWDISYLAYHAPYFPDQPDNVQVGWGYGLWADRPGNYVKKPMSECTGNEIMTELLYHLGMLDLAEGLLDHTYVSTCMMPYITSQFMPRHIADRPTVVPEGCTNLAFVGQYVETPSDAVFTVETSCRTGMYAAYALSGIEKKPLDTVATFYDLRYVKAQLQKMSGMQGDLTPKDLPKVNPFKLKQMEGQLLDLVNGIEPYPSIYPGKVAPGEDNV